MKAHDIPLQKNHTKTAAHSGKEQAAVKKSDLMILIFKRFHVLHITHNHQCNLKCDGILKHPKIQSGTLLEFIQAVYQCISVNVQLTRSLGYIQAILEEFIDGDKCLLIEVVRRFVM